MNVLDDITAWQRATFKHPTAAGIACHLHREALEVLEHVGVVTAFDSEGRAVLVAPYDDDDLDTDALAEECADVLILLQGLANLIGFDLLEEAEKKLAKNKTRAWKKPDAQGVIEHED